MPTTNNPLSQSFKVLPVVKTANGLFKVHLGSMHRENIKPSSPVEFMGCTVTQGFMEPLRVIEVEIGAEMGPRLGDRPTIMKVDFLVFDGSPETFDEDVVIDPAPAVHADANARLIEDIQELTGRKLGSWSVLKISGVEILRASSKAWIQKEASSVMDKSQARMYRLNQSLMATR